ncbi:MAG: hypothetical protein H6658_15290 [Ardenticatenaceae bacterium]|nr:hypothetical protein [Ardenticatenaceae bacterium]
MTPQTRYAAYLIRWQEGGSQGQWRAFAENAYTGEKIHFTSKLMLIQFLWQSLNDEANPTASAAESNINE